MAVGPIYGSQQHVCPKCGAAQESPGSTVCEQCGTELPLSGGSETRSPSPQPVRVQPTLLALKGHAARDYALRLKRTAVTVLLLPFRSAAALLLTIFRTVTALLKIAFRTAFALLLLALLIVGLSYVPSVSARVPFITVIAREIGTTADKGVERARKFAVGLLPRSQAKPAARRTSQPAATSKKPVPARQAAPLSLTVKSTPAGATVRFDGRTVGKTPMTVKVAPGTHTVTLSREGYVPVTRTLRIEPGKAGQLNVALTVARATTERAEPSPAPKPASAPTVGGKLLPVGARAPAIVLKDHRGTVHRLSDLRNRQVVVLFIWSIDAKTTRLVEELDTHVRGAGYRHPALIIVVNGDRASVQKFATSSKVQVPLLLGDDQIARVYGVPEQTTTLYAISKAGLIVQRQVKYVQLAPLFVEEQKQR